MKLPLCIWKLLVASLALYASTGTIAQPLPSAGSQLLQIPALPVEPSAPPDVRIKSNDPSPSPSPRADAGKVVVASIQFSGATVVPVSELIRQTGFVSGQSYTLGELRELAARVTSHYRSLGFFLAQTYVPPQDITNGMVQNNHPPAKPGVFKIVSRSKRLNGVANAAPTLGATETVAIYLHSPSCSSRSSSLS